MCYRTRSTLRISDGIIERQTGATLNARRHFIDGLIVIAWTMKTVTLFKFFFLSKKKEKEKKGRF